MEYDVVRSRRKSLVIVVESSAKVIVRAPLQMPDSAIKEFVRKNAQWIERRREERAKSEKENPSLAVETGESVMFLGAPRLIAKKRVGAIMLSGNGLVVPEDCRPEDLALWMRGEALRLIKERVAYYAEKMGVRPSAVKVSGAKSRWGSCSSKDSLNFAWRLIMCPPGAIDYVVIHELCHMTHKNHSPAFWALVEKYCPGFRESREWLRKNVEMMGVL